MKAARRLFSASAAASRERFPIRKSAGRRSVFAAAAIATLFSASSHAGLGDPLVAAGGDIVMRFEGTSANYQSLISVNNVEVNGQSLFFPNFTTPIGSTIDLGSFTAGMSLDITLHVITPGASNIWHTGAASLNLDNVIHANVIYDYNGEIGRVFVGFEDQFGGGDLDYNDHMFSFTGVVTTVPEPGTYSLMMAGLGALAFLARHRRAQQD
jgi:hypothetical protein